MTYNFNEIKRRRQFGSWNDPALLPLISSTSVVEFACEKQI